MTRILCTIRGGPESEETITRAVSLAEELDTRLIFLYVVNLDLIPSSSSVRVESIAKELSRMGEFILLMAQARAAAEGVAADTFVRQGNIPEQIWAAWRELHAEILIMGKPRHGNNKSFFSEIEQDAFVKKLQRDGKIKVIIEG
jgi:nucleotide-binding universal stress UspA family protein